MRSPHPRVFPLDPFPPSCLAEGVGLVGLDDDQIPPSGDVYFYLVQGYSVECGLGHLGFGSSEIQRENGNGAACVGAP